MIRWFIPQEIPPLLEAIYSLRNNTLIKIGEPYDLNILEQERIRLDSALKNRGFYYFNEQYLLFEADTTVGSDPEADYVDVDLKDTARTNTQSFSIPVVDSAEGEPLVNLYLKIKDRTPEKSRTIQQVGDIFILSGIQPGRYHCRCRV
ncbi:MAG: hypothetical protein HC880_16745 [Bacteroidia bacterium]|nr:hypothetical protein [Bacteroidia bacterium]